MAVLTEQQYRRWSADTSSRWYSTGNSIGVQQIVELVEDEVADHLDTYLTPTQVVSEVHRPVTFDLDNLGTARTFYYHVTTHRKRLLTDRSISVVWKAWRRSDCRATTTTGCAVVLDRLLGRLDLSRCLSSCGICLDTVNYDVLTVEVTYWCGLETLPKKIQRAIALMARYDAAELIAGVTPIMSDIPWGAPTTQRSDLGMSRSLDAPFRYAAGNQGISVFGRGHVGIAAQNMVSAWKVYGAYQI